MLHSECLRSPSSVCCPAVLPSSFFAYLYHWQCKGGCSPEHTLSTTSCVHSVLSHYYIIAFNSWMAFIKSGAFIMCDITYVRWCSNGVWFVAVDHNLHVATSHKAWPVTEGSQLTQIRWLGHAARSASWFWLAFSAQVICWRQLAVWRKRAICVPRMESLGVSESNSPFQCRDIVMSAQDRIRWVERLILLVSQHFIQASRSLYSHFRFKEILQDVI